MKRTVLLLPDQLNLHRGALADSSPADTTVLVIDSDRYLASRPWHRQRIFLFYSALEHFLVELRSAGYQVIKIRAANMADGITQYRNQHLTAELIAGEPNSISQQYALNQYGIKLVPNDFFLTSRSDFQAWANSQKSLKMENFYRQQRVRLNLLMSGDEPVGGI
jgi:deoxyribodipyrimidine photolyase-related protein